MKKIDHSYLFDKIQDFYSYISTCLPDGRSLYPLRYTFELTYRCNLTCNYCYIGDNRNLNELSAQEWLNVIKQIPPYRLITLVGGEPLLYKDFDTVFNQAVKRHKVNVVTNATLLNEELLRSFVEKKLILMGVSIDGIGEKHDNNRGKSGIFDKIVQNLEKLKEIKGKNQYPLLDIKTVVLENNIEDLFEIYKLSSYLGADFFTMSFLRQDNLLQNSSVKKESFDESFFNAEYSIEPYFNLEHFADVYNKILDFSKQSKTKIRFYPKFEHKDKLNQITRLFKQANALEINEIFNPCYYPWANLSISPDGEVYPCLSYKVGNLRENSFKEILNGNKFCSFRQHLKREKVFNACNMCCQLRVK